MPHDEIPGLFDMGPDLDLGASLPDQIAGAFDQAAAQGVTGLLIGVPPGPPEQMLKACQALSQAAGTIGEHVSADEAVAGTSAPRLLGIRLRSPFLNHVFADEAQLPFLRRPDAVLLAELMAAGGGRIRAVTLSPELPGASALMRSLAGQGARVGIGCSGLSFDSGLRAFREGACFVADSFGAMIRLHHREPGVIGAALLTPRAYLELRPGPGGVHPALVGICMKVAGAQRVILSGTWQGKTPLVGTALLRYVAEATGLPLRDLVPLASTSALAMLQLDMEVQRT